MSNIYEALKQAQNERQIELPVSQTPESGSVKSCLPSESSLTPTRVTMDAEMFSLYQNIEYLLPELPEKIIQFIGSREGEGVSTIVRKFARIANTRFGKRVLIMDAAHHNPTQHIYYNIKSDYGWKDVLGTGGPVNKACYMAGNTNLFLSPISAQAALTPYIQNQHAAASLFRELKAIFDLIIIDSSPATTSPDSIAMSRFSDGVVIVLEAEKTRWQMVENVREKITRSGGNVLGIVLNKRKFYIPESIYNHLC